VPVTIRDQSSGTQRDPDGRVGARKTCAAYAAGRSQISWFWPRQGVASGCDLCATAAGITDPCTAGLRASHPISPHKIAPSGSGNRPGGPGPPGVRCSECQHVRGAGSPARG
jgi:hypothetical protein